DIPAKYCALAGRMNRLSESKPFSHFDRFLSQFNAGMVCDAATSDTQRAGAPGARNNVTTLLRARIIEFGVHIKSYGQVFGLNCTVPTSASIRLGRVDRGSVTRRHN